MVSPSVRFGCVPPCRAGQAEKIDTQSFMTIATAIITFYFAKQQKGE